MRLSTRIGLAVGLTVPLLVLASGWLLLRLVARDLHQEEDAHLRRQAAAVLPDARSVLRAAAANRPDAEDNRERKLYSAALDVGVRVEGPVGTFQGGPQPPATVTLPARAPAPVTVRAAGHGWRSLSQDLSLKVKGSRVTGTLWVFQPDTADRTQVALVRRRVVMTALLAAPLSGLLAWGMATGATGPLRRLGRRTAGLDPRTSAARPLHEPTGVHEVDELAATLHTVLARYDEQAARTAEALETARSFSAAASHELRTPLMSIGTNLDILGDHPDLPDPDRAEVLTDLRREHARLLGLLVMLRDLGRGDLVEAEAFGRVDVAETADAAVGEARRRDPGARVALYAEPGLVVHGWEPGLRLLLDNLLGNALAHGRDARGRAEVAVGVRGTGTEVRIVVADRGAGVGPEARAWIFDRFRRGPGSAGSGLGLTLVAQQAALHGGSVTVADGPDGVGACFEVRLPRSGGTLPDRRDWLIATVGANRSQGSHKDGS
ncbi:HAMP domain-containing sensor histidine kinase [Streptomyces sp. NPDC048664]|uniref:sensor histidine kinase n=1 Tax=Streptomyces sp. NPDC048664 TaxID=3154505 RepID=UPI00342E46BC